MLEQSPGNFGNSRIPYDWYQTQTHAIITIRIANLKENDVKVTIINDALDVMCQLLDGRQFRMHFNLYKTVIVEDSNWAVDTSKLVINLRKADRKRWHSLETIPDKNVAEFESKENSTNAITITQTRNPNSLETSTMIEPISLDYNWYQDIKFINIVIHVPNIMLPDNRSFLFYEDDINIILTDNSLNWICNLPTGITNVTFKLFKEINSNESRYEISPCRSKIEIKLRKLQDDFWPSFVIQQQNSSPNSTEDQRLESNNESKSSEPELDTTTKKRNEDDDENAGDKVKKFKIIHSEQEKNEKNQVKPES
ncbi:suppressor of G2 allele of SKP1-like protein 2 [Sarcoptes scabiei]|uniref:Suppressor of G2 allele of SKP1-like protein 2 n=1 Tax=Sarcoptes scabiei TaxID=52283 RepID=A0A132A2M2_SARSC|nr:suppressor of G2 allele of SKP1-like protein 2 [Sarcoptes scabiei]